MSALGHGSHTSPVYLKALTAVVPYRPAGLEAGLSLALHAHEDVSGLLEALPDDLATTAWYDLYADRSTNLSASKIIFLLSPPSAIPASVSRELISADGLLVRWRASENAEVREACERFIMGTSSPKKRKRDDVDDLLRGVVEPSANPLRALKGAL